MAKLESVSKRHNDDNTEPIRFAPFESLKEAMESRKQKPTGTRRGTETVRSAELH